MGSIVSINVLTVVGSRGKWWVEIDKINLSSVLFENVSKDIQIIP
jgi:hypothetical protein